MSQGLFSYFASTDEGMIYGDWTFGTGQPAPTSNAPASVQADTDASVPESTPASTAGLPITTQDDIVQTTVTEPDGSVSTSTSTLANAQRTQTLSGTALVLAANPTQNALSGPVSEGGSTDMSDEQITATDTGDQAGTTDGSTQADDGESDPSNSTAVFRSGAQTRKSPARKSFQMVNSACAAFVFLVLVFWQL